MATYPKDQGSRATALRPVKPEGAPVLVARPFHPPALCSALPSHANGRCPTSQTLHIAHRSSHITHHTLGRLVDRSTVPLIPSQPSPSQLSGRHLGDKRHKASVSRLLGLAHSPTLPTMLALSVLLLHLLTTARALCIDPAAVHAVEARLAPIKAASKADCTVRPPHFCADSSLSAAPLATSTRTTRPARASADRTRCMAVRPCRVSPSTATADRKLIPAPDCGGAYSITPTYAPAGKTRRVDRDECPSGQMQCNTPTKGEWECVEVNSTAGTSTGVHC